MAIDASLRWLTGSFDAPGIDGELAALGGAFRDDYFAGELVALTGEFSGTSGANFSAELAPLASSFEITQGTVAGIDAVFEPIALEIRIPDALNGSLQAVSASFEALPGRVAGVEVVFVPLRGEFTAEAVGQAQLAAPFAFLQAEFSSHQDTPAALDASLRGIQAQFLGVGGQVAVLQPTAEPLQGAFSAYQVGTADAIGSQLEPLMAVFYSEPLIAATYRGWAMNMALAGKEDKAGRASSGMTEYENFPFNSFARFAGADLAAGPNGLMRLGGATDAGQDITASFATGLIDFDTPELKRATEVFLTLRTNGTLRISVWTDEDRRFDYVVPYYGRETLQQIRRRLGRGLRSRYFKYEIAGVNGARFDLDTMAIEAAALSRRAG